MIVTVKNSGESRKTVSFGYLNMMDGFLIPGDKRPWIKTSYLRTSSANAIVYSVNEWLWSNISVDTEVVPLAHDAISMVIDPSKLK